MDLCKHGGTQLLFQYCSLATKNFWLDTRVQKHNAIPIVAAPVHDSEVKENMTFR